MKKPDASLTARTVLGAGFIAFGLACFMPAGETQANGIEHFFSGEELGSAQDPFAFETTFHSPTLPNVPSGTLPSDPDDGLFFFHDTGNAEVVARIINQGAPSDYSNFVFFGSRTSVGFTTTVTNTQTMRVEFKSGVTGPAGFRSTARSTFNQVVTVRNTSSAPVNVGFNFSGSHHATGVFPTGPGSSTSHTISVDVNDGSGGFFDFGTQGHANTFSPGFNGTFGNLFPVGITQPAPGTWEFDEAAAPLTFTPLAGTLAPGEEADVTLFGLVEHQIINNGGSLADYDGFNTTVFDFELGPGLEFVAFVPEPSSLAILGLFSFGALRRRRI